MIISKNKRCCLQEPTATRRFLHNLIPVFILGIILCFTDGVFAQGGQTITGTVKNETGESLSGVTVTIKGTKIATSTAANGHYTITIPSSGSILVFTSIGFAPQEVKASNQDVLDISLKSQAGAMNEVVVVGYGTRKRATLTGSVTTVDSKTFQDRGPVSSPLAALQGQAPGVTVTRSSAQPGREGWNFQVRGATSVNGTEPLVIVDGLPIPSLSALNSFNPNDIENISFLKDASAAIYGARAAGGVVLITTKRAKAGKTVFEYNGSVSRKQIGLQPKLVDITGWGPMIKEARETDAYPATDVWINLASASIYAVQNGITYMPYSRYKELGYLGFTDVKDFVFFPGTMQDVLWGDATSTEHQFSMSNRGEKSGYRISLGYLDDGSLLQWGNNTNKRYNFRMAHDYQLTQKLKLESNISLEKNDIVQPTGLGNILNNGNQPGFPLAAQNDKAYLWGSGLGNATVNNIAALGGENKELNTRINTNFSLTYNIVKNLKAVGNLGYYFHNTDYRTRDELIPWYDYTGTQLITTLTGSNQSRNSYQRATRRESYYNLNGYLEWGKVLGRAHDVRAMAGAQYERDELNRFFARTSDVIAGVPSSLSLTTATDGAGRSLSEAQNHYALAGYFSRINYSYKNKYLFEANARYDGSSKFRAEDRWKFFYGFLSGWRISQEEFMKDLVFLNELKLRVSWGSVGNQSGIGLYDYVQQMTLNSSSGPTASGFPIIGSAPSIRIAPGSLVAFDRTWEKVETSNAGLDFGLLKNRLTGSLDYFIKRNKGMLIGRTLPAVLGATPPEGNNGELETKGWEFGVNWRDRIGEVTYHIGGNISDAKNKLVNYGGQNVVDINRDNLGLIGAVEGYPMNSYFGLQYAGRIQNQKDLDAYKKLIGNSTVGMSNVIPQGTTPQNGLQLGDNMWMDVNGDGKISFPQDAVFLGTNDPRYSYSFNGGAEWKGFDVNFIFQGVGKRTLIRTGNWRVPAAVIFQAQNAAFLNEWWTPNRTDAHYPRISTTSATPAPGTTTPNWHNYFPSNWLSEDGSYLRLKNLVVGYTLPQSLTQKAKIQRLRFYFSGNDLWETSNIRDGWDPEAPREVNNTADANNNNVTTFSQRFPFYRYYTFGLNLTF